MPPLPFFIPALLARRGTFTRRNNFVVLSVWHPPTLLPTKGGEEEEEKEKSLLRLVGWWGSHGSGAAASGAPAKPLGATLCHPVAAGLWDTRQVAAKHLIATPPIKGEEDKVCKDSQDDSK